MSRPNETVRTLRYTSNSTLEAARDAHKGEEARVDRGETGGGLKP